MIGNSHDDRRRGRRRGLALLLLLPLSFVFGGVSATMYHGASPSASSAPITTPTSAQSRAVVAEASATPAATGTEVVHGVEATGSASPAPSVTVVVSGVYFGISGGVSGLRPGVVSPIRLTLTNPNDVPIYVTSLTVAIAPDSTPPGCRTATNIVVTQSNVSGSAPVAVPANGAVTVAAAPRAPQITLLNLANVNQDVCKGKSFNLTYGGSAHS